MYVDKVRTIHIFHLPTLFLCGFLVNLSDPSLSELLEVKVPLTYWNYRKLGYHSPLMLMSSVTQIQLIDSPGVFAHL